MTDKWEDEGGAVRESGEERMLKLYGLALDEVYRLRALMAYEAEVTAAHLTLKGFPKSRRDIAVHQITRMRDAARGHSRHVMMNEVSMYTSFQRVLRQAGAKPTLTRWEFEKELRGT